MGRMRIFWMALAVAAVIFAAPLTAASQDTQPPTNDEIGGVLEQLGIAPRDEGDASQQSVDPQTPATCCKYCRKGKACGNSCIKISYTCNKPPGCACDVY